MSDHKNSKTLALALGALGVVYGDIGTSPLYALKESLVHAGFDPTADIRPQVFGPISLIFWSLTLMASIKYLLLLSHATSQGEGGIFALLSLVRSGPKRLSARATNGFVLCALFGAALLYGDGMITPAISILSAVEGLGDARLGAVGETLKHYVVPIAGVILVALFAVQRHGTRRMGVFFGPVMIVWFAVLAALGVRQCMGCPEILLALSPHYGVLYLTHHGLHGIVIMGMVLLAVTGCEAMYADIGHFGRGPMQRAWFCLAYPALILNYLGQGALLLQSPGVLLESGPFYGLAPEWLILPLIVLATAATIIASQAMITGVYSLTQQAVQLGYLPRLKIVHTNPDMRGQIFMPQVNVMLLAACLALVFHFKTSSNLASAYGFSVAMGMLLTTALLFGVSRRIWHWPWSKALLAAAVFGTVECSYVAGSLSKFWEGAWFPLVVAIGIWIIMKTWRDGRAILHQAMQRGRLPVEHLIRELTEERIQRVPGTAVFLSASAEGLPNALLHHLKHNKVLHEHVVLLSVKFMDTPRLEGNERVAMETLHTNFFRVVLHYGFSESPHVFHDLCAALPKHPKIKPPQITFYQSRELLLSDGPGRMAKWRKSLFILLSRMARPATGFFELPSRQVVELGIQLEL